MMQSMEVRDGKRCSRSHYSHRGRGSAEVALKLIASARGSRRRIPSDMYQFPLSGSTTSEKCLIIHPNPYEYK